MAAARLLLLAFQIATCYCAAIQEREGKNFPLYSYEPDYTLQINSDELSRHSQAVPMYTPEQFQQGAVIASSDDSYVSSDDKIDLKNLWNDAKEYFSRAYETTRSFLGVSNDQELAEKRSDSTGLNVDLPDPVRYSYQDPAGYSMQSGFEGYIVPSMPHLGGKGPTAGLIIAVAVLSGILAVVLPMALGWSKMFTMIQTPFKRLLGLPREGRSEDGQQVEPYNNVVSAFIAEEILQGIDRFREQYKKKE